MVWLHLDRTNCNHALKGSACRRPYSGCTCIIKSGQGSLAEEILDRSLGKQGLEVQDVRPGGSLTNDLTDVTGTLWPIDLCC